MAISKKPTKEKVSEAEIKAIIEKGGTPAKEEPSEQTRKNLQLRLESTLIDQIDEVRKKRMVPPPRHTWILEAIYEKIQRDNNIV